MDAGNQSSQVSKTRNDQIKMAMRKYRAKIRENKENLKEYRKKDAERKVQERTKKRNLLRKNETLANIVRQKERERKRIYRLKQRQLKQRQSSLGTGYKCKQTLGKALKKVRQTLPESPNKRKTVIKHLALETVPELLKPENNVSKRVSVPNPEQKTITEFFNRDDVNRQAPGKRDTKSVKDISTGRREVFQKRHMILTVKEAFAYYKDLYPESSIQKSKFYNLRPKHVLLSSDMPHNVCVCKYHANFNFLNEAIHNKFINFPESCAKLLEKVCCDITNETCMTNECMRCETDLSLSLLSVSQYVNMDNIILMWKQWQNIDGRPQIVSTEASLRIAINTLEKQLNQFKVHLYVKRVQDQYFQLTKESISLNEVVVQVDFAENYSLVSQDEIQAAHWTHKQVTIFTCVAWLTNSTESFAIVSDDLTHSKYAVYVFIKKIIRVLQDKFKEINKVKIFSDGCAAQFKNKYTLSNLLFFPTDFGISAEWNFFATSHGKGAVDGIGGLVKRLVWMNVKSRKSEITSAYDFYQCAKAKVTNVNVMLITKSDIEETKEMLDGRWQKVSRIPQVQSKHCFKAESPNRLITKRTFQSSENVYSILT